MCDYPTFLYGRPSQATIEAMVPRRVLRVTGQQLEQFINQNLETMKLRVFLVNPKNPVRNLTIEQIQKIYTGEIRNWKD